MSIPDRLMKPSSAMKPNGCEVESSPSVTPMSASGTTSQTTAVCFSELNSATVMSTMSSTKTGNDAARDACALRLSLYSPHHSSVYPSGSSIASTSGRTLASIGGASPTRGSARVLIARMRFMRTMISSSKVVSKSDTTWRSGMDRPAAGLNIWMLRMLVTSMRCGAGARATIGSSSSRSRYTPNVAPSKLSSNAVAMSVRVMPARLACSSATTGRTTFTRSRQSVLIPYRLGSARKIASASEARLRSTSGSGPKKRAWILPGSPGPRMNFRVCTIAPGYDSSSSR